jgi:hypothetical protein
MVSAHGLLSVCGLSLIPETIKMYEARDKARALYVESLGLNPNRCIDEFTLDELEEAFNAGWLARKHAEIELKLLTDD